MAKKSLYESFMKGVAKSKKETPAKKTTDKLLEKRARRKSRQSKFKRTVREAVHGSKTYMPKDNKAKPSSTKPKAAWKTSQEMAEMENLGEEMAKLRRKGKK